jgi:hypothetical protein
MIHTRMFRRLLKKSDFEIYEIAGKTYVNKEIFQEIRAPIKRKLDLRKIVNSLINCYYRLEEEMEDYIGISVKVLRAAPRILSLKMMPTFPSPCPPNPCV